MWWKKFSRFNETIRKNKEREKAIQQAIIRVAMDSLRLAASRAILWQLQNSFIRKVNAKSGDIISPNTGKGLQNVKLIINNKEVG